jgi:hypothetical protein
MDNRSLVKPRYVSVHDWMVIGGDSERTVRQQIADGKLPAIREGDRVQIDLQAALERKKRLPSAAKPMAAAR